MLLYEICGYIFVLLILEFSQIIASMTRMWAGVSKCFLRPSYNDIHTMVFAVISNFEEKFRLSVEHNGCTKILILAPLIIFREENLGFTNCRALLRRVRLA